MATNQPCIQPCTSHLTSIASGFSIFTSKFFLNFGCAMLNGLLTLL